MSEKTSQHDVQALVDEGILRFEGHEMFYTTALRVFSYVKETPMEFGVEIWSFDGHTTGRLYGKENHSIYGEMEPGLAEAIYEYTKEKGLRRQLITAPKSR
jgi:hypothetical protein